MYDFIVIGSGLAGSIIAERIANVSHKKVLIIEKKDHVGGNVYDYVDNNGILIHKYGPHIFHTDNKKVWDYISCFTDWNLYQHKVLGYVDGNLIPIPFNLNSMKRVFPKFVYNKLEKKLYEEFGFNIKVPILKLKESNDADLKFLAIYVYEKIFLNYTLKQWGVKPEDIDHSVTGRVPVYISRDDRYFQDKYQGVPKNGYTQTILNILNHKNIKVILNTNMKDVIKINSEKIFFMNEEFNGKLIYTGMIDEFFDYKYGELPYISLKFDFVYQKEEKFQDVGTINYPNDYDFTRITEFKHITGQDIFGTTCIYEYPGMNNKNSKEFNIPYYPVFKQENQHLYNKYSEETKKLKNVFMLGRLAEYKYYDMDDIIERSLNFFELIK